MFGPSESGRPSRASVRVLMDLDEERVHADRDRRPRQGRHVLALAAGAVPLPARELDRVGRVEDHRVPSARMIGRPRKSTTRLL